jgi:hypothetical protein
MGLGKQPVSWLRVVAFLQANEGANRAIRAFAIADAALAPNLDFKNGLAGILVFDDPDIAVFQPGRFIRSKTFLSSPEQESRNIFRAFRGSVGSAWRSDECRSLPWGASRCTACGG